MLKLYNMQKNNLLKWEKDFNKLMKDNYIKNKYNRAKRLKDKEHYINTYLKEIKNNDNVLDIGPGPGEFLEICRSKGCKVFGLDAINGDSEMGDEYLKLSQLMTQRQNLNVYYIGADKVFLNEISFPFKFNYFNIINSQGAIEQVFKRHLIGVPCRVHKNCNLLKWSMSKQMFTDFKMFFENIYKLLTNNGICFIYANGAKNTKDYNDLIHKIIENINGLKIIVSEKNVIHKIKKEKI